MALTSNIKSSYSLLNREKKQILKFEKQETVNVFIFPE